MTKGFFFCFHVQFENFFVCFSHFQRNSEDVVIMTTRSPSNGRLLHLLRRGDLLLALFCLLLGLPEELLLPEEDEDEDDDRLLFR